jgi:hypothetical protein
LIIITVLFWTACDNSTGPGNELVAVTGVTLNQPGLTLGVGKTAVLTAGITPNNATNKAVTWSSSNPGIATVTNGTVSGVAGGTAIITVTTTDGGFTAACAVTVTVTSITYITLSGVPAKTNYAIGEAFDVTGLSLIVYYTDNTTVTIPVTAAMISPADWNASKGTKTITITYSGFTAPPFTVTVTPDGSPPTGEGTIQYYWVNELNNLVLSGTSLSISNAPGQAVTISAGGTGYTGQRWYINGEIDNTHYEAPDYTFKGAGRDPGDYIIGLQVWMTVGGKNQSYYAEITVTVRAQ